MDDSLQVTLCETEIIEDGILNPLSSEEDRNENEKAQKRTLRNRKRRRRRNAIMRQRLRDFVRNLPYQRSEHGLKAKI